MDLKIKLSGDFVSLWQDKGTRCCGESRSDWTHLGHVRLDELVKGLEKLVKKEEKEIWL